MIPTRFGLSAQTVSGRGTLTVTRPEAFFLSGNADHAILEATDLGQLNESLQKTFA